MLPELVRLILTALIGALIGLVTYEFIYWLMPLSPRATLSWGAAYLIGIARQHGLHRTLTYYHQNSPYWTSLARAYLMYSGSYSWSYA
jgi:putative flippase GtrA